MKTLLVVVLALSFAAMSAEQGVDPRPEEAARACEAAGDFASALALRQKIVDAAVANLKAAKSRIEVGQGTMEEVRAAELLVAAEQVKIAQLQNAIQDKAKFKEANEPWRVKLNARLDQPVSMDFMNADLEWTANTLQTLTGVPIMLDPQIEAGKVSLHVEDMPLRNVLNWICRQGRMKWEIADRSVYLTGAGKAPARAEGARRFEAGARLRVKLPGGEEVEASAEVLNRFPGLAEDLLDRALDPARDGFLAYRVAPQGPGLTLAELAKRVEACAPGAKVTDDGAGLALVTCEKPADLAGLAARLRLQGLYRARGPEPAKPEKAEIEQAVPAAPGAGWPAMPEGTVLSVKEDQNLLMVSIGNEQGVRANMPVRVLREGKVVATGRVERVYPDMSSVRLENAPGAKVAVHDQVLIGRQAEEDPPAPEEAKRAPARP